MKLRITEKIFVNMAYYILIFIVIIGILSLIFFIQSEGKKCLEQPFIYSANKLNSENVICSCRGIEEGVISKPFYFNKNSSWYEN